MPRGDTVQSNGANEGEPKRCGSRQYGFNSREVIEEQQTEKRRSDDDEQRMRSDTMGFISLEDEVD